MSDTPIEKMTDLELARARVSARRARDARIHGNISERCRKTGRKYDVFAAAESSRMNRAAPITLPKLKFMGEV